MNGYILPLSDPQADLGIVGGKGMSLAKLAIAGFPVPDGFHITTEAYRLFVKENDLQASITQALDHVNLSQPSTLEEVASTISALFEQSVIPHNLAKAIIREYAALPDKDSIVAVRSSATAEDLPEASFAGQQESYLNVIGADQVLAAVKKCWASLWTARAIGYRSRQNIPPDGVALAVVVQLLVKAEAAGILFTANPISGNRNELVINAAWGLGEAIVGGVVTPDTLIVQKSTGRVLQREIGRKTVMTVRTDQGTMEQPVPEGLQSIPILSDDQAAQLAQIGASIEEFYGMPMDIEWTLAEGRFAVVQARPITALPDAPIVFNPPNPKSTYMRTSVADLMPSPLSPLFITWCLPTMKKQMNPLAERVTRSKPVLPEDYYTTINNYAYMNTAFPPRSMWWILTGLLPAYPKLMRILVSMWREEFHPEYQSAVEQYKDINLQAMTAGEIWQEAQKLLDAVTYYICALMFATMGASAGSEGLLTQTYNKFVKQEGDPAAATLLMGWDNIPVRSDKSLFDIATWCKKDDSLAAYLLETETSKLVDKMKKEETPGNIPTSIWEEFKQRFEMHMEKFGHIVFQLDFSEPLPLDHPDMLLENVKMYLRGEGSNPHERQKASQVKRIETTHYALGRVKGIKRWLFKKTLNWGQSMAEVREDALSEIGLGYPTLRKMLLEIGSRLVREGAIQETEDIFWLEYDEISACITRLDNRKDLEDLAARVVARQSLHHRLENVTPPPMMPLKKRVFGIKTEVFMAQTEGSQLGLVLKGEPTSAGRVSAPACILHGPEDFENMRLGDVIVAGTTTPAWTPLFTMASAVVTDIGGPLSHGSIVAREYGIPAVMGTGVATRRIQNGQIITVDGTKGEVILEAGKEGENALKPPTEWKLPDPKSTYARGSLAEHTPSPVSPLFATLGLKTANKATDNMWKELIGREDIDVYEGGFYQTINEYVYAGFKLSGSAVWRILQVFVTQMRLMLTATREKWQAARQEYAQVVSEWQSKSLEQLSPSDLLLGVREVFGAAIRYFTVIQSSTLPSATFTEMIFVPFYKRLIKRKQDPEASSLLLGFETMPLQAEKSLFDLAQWVSETALKTAFLQSSSESIWTAVQKGAIPDGISEELWEEWKTRFQQHLDTFGVTTYDFDFANPVPSEAPGPMLDAIKMYLEGKGTNPYQRQQELANTREQATRSILDRIGWPRKSWFQKLLGWTQSVAPIREDSIFDMGMGHPIIRRLLAELGKRIVDGGAIETTADIYWLEENELENLVAALETGQTLPMLSEQVPVRKARCQAAQKAIPPVMLPQKSRWSNLLGGREARGENGKLILKGVGTSGGQITAPACVLNGPEDFDKMKPGDVLVATTTTPAWTPLFAMASAVVTDIGGPLSHSSIVAREYGIPAVMAARNASRHIKNGQIVTVDGNAGIVTLDYYET